MALDYQFSDIKNLRLENVASLPSGYGADHTGAVVVCGGVQYTWSGTAWVCAGGAPVPSNVVFVSPNFPNVFPFYSTIQAANNNCPTTSTIHVYPGTYDMKLDLYRTMYCEPGVVLSDTSTGSLLQLHGDSSRLLGHAILLFNYADSMVTITYTQYIGTAPNVFECDSFTYGSNVTRDTTGALYLWGGGWDKIYTIRVRDLNCRVNNVCGIYYGPHNTRDRINIECDYLYQLYQKYDKNATPVHSIVRCREFEYIEIAMGTCICDFEVNYSPNRAVYVVRNGELTLRNGLIYCTGTTPAESVAIEVINSNDSPLLRLEQVSIYDPHVYNITMNSASGIGTPRLFTKNCTFQADMNATISGDSSTFCIVKNMGGGSVANAPFDNVVEIVQNVYIDSNVEV